MNSKDKEFIHNNREVLADVIDLNPNLVDQMINKNIFTQKMMDDIQVFV